MFVTIIAALAAAFLNASSSVMQRRAASESDDRLFSRDLIKYFATHRLFIGGMALQTAAFGLQALALANGLISVVEPVLTVDLLFMLLLMYLFFHVPLGKRAWAGAAATAGGLAGFLLAAGPTPGHINNKPLDWVILGAIFVVLGTAISLVALRQRPTPKAALLGVVAGSSYALTAAMTKLTAHRFNSHGLLAVFTGWEVYALIVVGTTAVIMMQNVYRAGPLVASQPAMMTADPLLSIVIGVLLFGEKINRTPAAIGAEIGMLALLVAGIVILTNSPALRREQELSAER